MPHLRAFVSILAVAALTACAAEEPTAVPEPVVTTQAPVATATPAPETAAPGSLAQKKFGEPITESQDTALESIVANPAAFADKTVRTTGVVLAVCQAAGCWMEIGDTAQRAHVKMAGHAFLVPKSAGGHRAVVQGTVKAGEPANECGKKDSCGGADNGALAKLEIMATGVEFLD